MALDLTTLANIRYNPFTGVWTPRQIGYGAEPVEQHTIPASGPYIIQLYEKIEQNAPSTTIINLTSGGTLLKEVSMTTSPGNLQYRVCYDDLGNGQVEFNSAQAGLGVNVKYYGLGHILQKATIDGAVDYFDQYGYTKYTAGVYSNTTLAGLCEIILIGGGGGGGGGSSGIAGGGGGGHGGIVRMILNINNLCNLTVGTGGTAGALAGNGGAGNSTSIQDGSFSITAAGGGGGFANGNAGAAAGAVAFTGSMQSMGFLTESVSGTAGTSGGNCAGGRGGGPGGGAGGGGTGVAGTVGAVYGNGGGGGSGYSGNPKVGGAGADGVIFIRVIQPA